MVSFTSHIPRFFQLNMKVGMRTIDEIISGMRNVASENVDEIVEAYARKIWVCSSLVNFLWFSII